MTKPSALCDHSFWCKLDPKKLFAIISKTFHFSDLLKNYKARCEGSVKGFGVGSSPEKIFYLTDFWKLGKSLAKYARGSLRLN